MARTTTILHTVGLVAAIGALPCFSFFLPQLHTLSCSSKPHFLMQVVATLAAVAGTAMMLAGLGGPAAIILGGGLALSSTAVAMQVLQDRGESGSRHGRATFAVLLLQASLLFYRQLIMCLY